MKNNYSITINRTGLPTQLLRVVFSLLILTGLSSATYAINSTAKGGLWSNPQTWVGGVAPVAADAVTIVDGAVVTVDAAVTVSSLTVGGGTSGVLQWNSTASTLAVNGNLLINSGGLFACYTTGLLAVQLNLTGNFTNNGTANLALTTLLTFGSSAQTISGTGNFIGTGTDGIIRFWQNQNPSTVTINTTQNIIVTSQLTQANGSIITNGKLKVDNTAQVYGQALNFQVANVALTSMGTYSVAPVVFGATNGGKAAVAHLRRCPGRMDDLPGVLSMHPVCRIFMEPCRFCENRAARSYESARHCGVNSLCDVTNGLAVESFHARGSSAASAVVVNCGSGAKLCGLGDDGAAAATVVVVANE